MNLNMDLLEAKFNHFKISCQPPCLLAYFRSYIKALPNSSVNLEVSMTISAGKAHAWLRALSFLFGIQFFD